MDNLTLVGLIALSAALPPVWGWLVLRVYVRLGLHRRLPQPRPEHALTLHEPVSDPWYYQI